MRVAMITPEVIEQPSSGYHNRLLQTQTVLSRVFPDDAMAWDLMRAGPINLHNLRALSQKTARSRRSYDRKSIRYALKNMTALAMHIWPSFMIQSLRSAKAQILAWIDQYQPDAVVLVHPYSTELTPDLVARGLKVFVDTQNVESDLVKQLITIAPSVRKKIELLVRWKTLERWEQKLFPLANSVWMPSRDDVVRQQRVCQNEAQVLYIPNTLDVAKYKMRSGESSHDIILPAYFGHSPNVVGAKALRDQVLPKVREVIPDARLMLLGRDPTGAAQALVNGPHIVATGEVPDTRPYLEKAGVVAVPIFQGGGTRYKILEALAMGLPVVTTPLGCEGIAVRNREHLLIEAFDQFAPAIISLLQDPAKGHELGKRGRIVVEDQYSWNVVEKYIRQAISGSSVQPEYA